MKWPRKNYAVYGYYPKSGSNTGETYTMFESSHWTQASANEHAHRLNTVVFYVSPKPRVEFRVERINDLR